MNKFDGSITYKCQKESKIVGDLNNAKPQAGADIIFYKSAFQSDNAPSYSSNYWFGYTMRAGEPNYFVQIAYDLSDEIYMRQYYAGNDVWSAWRQI